MDYILSCCSHIPAVTSIANIFIDKYMLSANGSYVKVYLYFSRCIQAGYRDISVAGVADKMEITEKDVLRALQYWEKQHLMILSYDEYSELKGVDLIMPDDLYASDSNIASVSDSSSVSNAATARQTSYTDNDTTATLESSGNAAADSGTQNTASNNVDISVPGDTLEMLAGNENYTWTCHVIESYLNRPLKSSEVQLISYLYGVLGFSSDLLIYLYDYCISLGKTSVNYIQAVAFSWNDEHIKTPEEAKMKTTSYNSVYTAISKSFGLGRPLAMIEKKYVDRWQNDWNMDLSVIIDACNRTMLKIHKADFKYTEGILDNWHKADIHTLQGVEEADKIYAERQADKKAQKASSKTVNNHSGNYNKNQFKSFQQRGASQSEVDELEKRLLRH